MVVYCQPYAPTALPPGNAPGTHSCHRLSRPPGAIVRSEGFKSMKNPMTPAGIEPATIRFVTQHLNHLPPTLCLKILNLSHALT